MISLLNLDVVVDVLAEKVKTLKQSQGFYQGKWLKAFKRIDQLTKALEDAGVEVPDYTDETDCR